MLTQEIVKSLFWYDPDTGYLTWKNRLDSRCYGGKRAGSIRSSGYRGVIIFGKEYKEHRVIWLLVYGYWPEKCIDHINGHKDDNRVLNLREVSMLCNSQNRGMLTKNSSGFVGVSLITRVKSPMWQATIRIKGKSNYLGWYDDPLEAALARYTCEQWHKDFHCGDRKASKKAIQKVWPEFKD